MEKQTVFVVLNEWSYDYESDQDVMVFKTREEATDALKEAYHHYADVDDGFIERHFDMKEICEEHGYACYYEEGDWTRYHVSWTIYERTIQ